MTVESKQFIRDIKHIPTAESRPRIRSALRWKASTGNILASPFSD
jgi:hypothetical protein